MTEISCDTTRDFLELAVEDELDLVRRRALAAHLEVCAPCREVHEELLDEKRWILENAVRSPQLPGHFARRLCDRLREEGATSRDLASPFEPGVETGAAESRSHRKATPRAGAVGLLLPWLSAAAVAVVLASLASLFERAGSHEGPPLFVARPRPPAPLSPVSPDGEWCSPDDGTSLLARASVSLAAAPVNLRWDDAEAIQSPRFCSVDRPGEWVALCPEIDKDAEVSADSSDRPGPADWQDPCTMGRVFHLTARLVARDARPGAPASLEPCEDDLNRDGELDYRDITILCQLVMQPAAVGPSSSLGALAAAPGEDDAAADDCGELAEDCI